MANETQNLNEFLRTNAYGIYDELPVGIALCDSDGRVTDCNEYYLEVLGVGRKDILGYNIFDSYNFTDEVMDEIRTSDSYRYDVLYTMPKDVFKNASVDTISISVKIVRCQDADRTTGYIIYITNHTNEWKKYEAQLAVQDRRYRDLVDNIPLDYTHTKLIFDENGQIADYLNMSGNKSCNDFYIEHGMTWGSTLATKFLPETGHVIIGKLNELRNSGATGGHFTYDAKEVGEIYEMVVVFEGEEWVNLISIPITSLEKEKREAENKLHEEQLAKRRREKEYNDTMKSLSNIYSTIVKVEIDRHHYEVFNSAALTEAGAESAGTFEDQKELIFSALVDAETRDLMEAFLDFDTLAERLQDLDTISTEYKSSNGRWKEARFIVKRRDEAGTAKEALYVVHDITDEKTRELQQKEALKHALAAAQQANRAKTTFLNSMSHDIRTPMNAIIGYTALAQSHAKDENQVQDYLGKIGTSSTHLLNLINDILDMSRIESGTVKLEEKPVHIPDLLQDLRTMIQGMVNAKSLHLSIDTQDVVHEDVLTDKLRLNQILLNIASNAVKFTQPGGNIAIRLMEKNCSRKHYTTYEFSVRDNGIGMSKEFLGHIFETFTREQSATVSGIQGTGLGMAITKNIVDMMGGDIQVESEEGKGSVFTVTLHLPLADEPVVSERLVKEEEKKRRYDYSGKHVLLVEDNELNREIATAILEETGMTIDSVNDGDDAVAVIDREPADKYDLILMDVQMPRMDGYTATREIRALPDDRKANIPIVAMTANAFEEDRKMAFEAGMNGHIIKPISIEAIAKALDEVFAEKK